jgi:hypothetical protein
MNIVLTTPGLTYKKYYEELNAAIDSALIKTTPEIILTVKNLALNALKLLEQSSLSDQYEQSNLSKQEDTTPQCLRSICEFSGLWVNTQETIASFNKEGLEMTDEVLKTDKEFKQALDIFRHGAENNILPSGIATLVMRVGMEINENYIERKGTYKKIFLLAEQLKNDISKRTAEQLNLEVATHTPDQLNLEVITRNTNDLKNAELQITGLFVKLHADLKLSDEKDKISISSIKKINTFANTKLEQIRGNFGI